MKNLKKLKRSHLISINGGDYAYADCDIEGNCPAVSGSYYCSGGTCYRSTGGGNPGGGTCHEPQRDCMPWETGCGCVY
ncbi:hypothetical protein C1637_21015 [Chryseobacterium lactis]|uniref:Bacteriocin n=1 Tax=Chryseobacterium lactis TaxID=1241981 RepID=A0A3G6RKT2_CHRLC|nr:hypothetical protein [Chryseobacterium lactis]AZA83445.1 hypothetical protein EG342_16845 [Chryseobacterium lactis]AZB03829.1 hypothetical protein EG341_07720 [Chryseobacterium lactis]PNW11594.1 hypothetical protein C1637_21015 [Chryseobacterium lactis]